MVQQEVKKKTRIYGTVAALSAIVLVALIFVFGSTPNLTPTQPSPSPAVSAMKTFTSYDELKSYINANAVGPISVYPRGPLDAQFFGGRAELVPAPDTIGFAGLYSTTNIQVAGVDEADIVKTDGQYIYVATTNDYYSASQNNVYIVKAAPQDPRVIAKISLGNETYVAGLYLSQDSNQLVVLGSQYQVYAYNGLQPSLAIYPYYSSVNTFLSVYDISEKAAPVLARNLTLSGSYFNSRMIGDYVYVVVSQSAYVYEDVVPLPKVYTATGTDEIPATKVYYSDTANYTYAENNYFTFTSFYGLNLKNLSQELTNMTILMGGASTMYVSLGNMYVTYPTWSEGGGYTSIYRVSVNQDALSFEAKGSVPGYVLNQYSMDEYNGNFRLATTSWNDTTRNAVYVLNSNLTAVGEVKLENAEVRETIQSVRFMGDKAYIVTFQQKDPFFVLDMSNPTAPRVAGKLEIPGFSSYLHPYDENHVIGLGMENNTVKLSLFDVTNVNAPTEIAKYIVQGDYTSSDALYEPKAFLFDKQKQLLVIPVSITQYGVVSGGGVVPPSGAGGAASTPVLEGGYWQGAYVFKLTLSGFELKGGVTHQENTSQQYYGDYNLNVNRALYIGNTLYTVSNAKVLLNDLDSLALIAEVNLR
jgi:inhibitor of cysteine peptidase